MRDVGRLGPPLLGLLSLLGGCVLSAGGGGDDEAVDAAAPFDAQAPPDADPNAPDASTPDAQAQIIDANTGPPDADLSCFGEVAVPIQLGVLHTGSTTGASNNGSNSCGSDGPEIYHRLVLDDTILPASVNFALQGGSTNYDAIIKVFQGCGPASIELDCNDDGGGDDQVTLALSIPGVYYVVVDSHGGSSGDFGFIVTATPTP